MMLPVPIFGALLLGYLSVRILFGGGRPLLVAFLASCAAQSFLVGVVGGYNIDWLRVVLPISATVIPPLAWITFRDALVIRLPLRDVAMHAAAPVFTLFCRIFAPETLDVVVPLVFLGYGGAVLMTLRASSDMPLARLETGQRSVLLWRVLGWFLILSALTDVLIAMAYIAGNADWAAWMITASSSLVLLLIGLLSCSPAAVGANIEEENYPSQTSSLDIAQDAEIVTRLDTFLAREAVYLDPNLTLARLARRLHLPEKRLSAAVNRVTNSNVSRYVNSWRIRHACKLIEEGSLVTDAMLTSGFNTKSNFNREFRRVTGVAPTQWSGNIKSSPRIKMNTDVEQGDSRK